MSQITIIFLPLDKSIDLSTTILGFIDFLEKSNNFKKKYFFQPISNQIFNKKNLDKTLEIIKFNKLISFIPVLKKISIDDIFNKNRFSIIYNKILKNFYSSKKKSDLVLVEGLKLVKDYEHIINQVNFEISMILNANIIFVSKKDITDVYYNNRIDFYMKKYLTKYSLVPLGIIVNKLLSIIDNSSYFFSKEKKFLNSNKIIFSKKKSTVSYNYKSFNNNKELIPVIASIPRSKKLVNFSASILFNFLKIKILNEGNLKDCIVRDFFLLNFIHENIFKKNYLGSIIIVSFTNQYLVDILLKNKKLQKEMSVLFFVDLKDSKIEFVREFCKKLIKKDLPVVYSSKNIFKVLNLLEKNFFSILNKSYFEIKLVQRFISSCICIKKWNNLFRKCIKIKKEKKFVESGTIFKIKLKKIATSFPNISRIIFPEGNELRIIKAVNFCSNNKIAKCILLGDEEKIKYLCIKNKIVLDNKIKIINPTSIRNRYISNLVKIRKHKGMNEIEAHRCLETDNNNITLATLMLEEGKVDGLVAGSTTTTANTIRPGLQLIKMSKGYNFISSYFFMLFHDKVLIYSDCAINIDPDENQLSEIAIQSAESAIQFNINPIVAMISYSTGDSASGKKVEIIRKATNLVRLKRPDIVIDGPIQYDAAIDFKTGKIKSPNSLVAGRATVIIFPDLNTGNTTYKAVQRSANISSIGPILQGMKKPINDLSRGASVEDIIYTITVTAIQSKFKK
ncbi:Phosphate acetyltransferase [Buchnera aphidicola (Tetraneura ulmi)]|uniref:phosphate acetyltransferase n=1 Tax=Buchnera aphidicola TaxID=9 RepID=UPI003464CBDD